MSSRVPTNTASPPTDRVLRHAAKRLTEIIREMAAKSKERSLLINSYVKERNEIERMIMRRET